ncbi:pilin [Vibrio zhugei]|uniref:Pilin n=1 Tax=Vibrio zhugei TaxID=2479546 RepID=A0ABV7CD10_9VIBR|nr:pilin [Vibrio zhugei]
MTYARRYTQGFSLIELMIVVSIIATLSAIAIPAYHNYVLKSQLTAGVAFLNSLVTPAELYLQEHGSLDESTDLAQLGVSPDKSPLGTLKIEQGDLTFHFHQPNGAVATLSRDHQLGWQCEMTLTNTQLTEYIPAGCR